MKPKNFSEDDYVKNKHGDFQLLEFIFNFWNESICPWGLCATGISYPSGFICKPENENQTKWPKGDEASLFCPLYFSAHA